MEHKHLPTEACEKVKYLEQQLHKFKQSEKELRESEHKYRNLIECSLNGMIIIQNGRPVFVSAACSRITGYTEKEMLSFSIETIESFFLPSIVAMTFSAAFEMPNEEERFRGYERSFTHKNGQLRWLEAFASTLDYLGKPAIQITFADITNRKKAEEALRESKEKFKTIFENVHDAIVYVDVDGTILDVNSKVRSIFGYLPKEMIRRKFYEIDYFSPMEAERSRAVFKSVISGHRLPMQEFEIIRKDHTNVFVEVSAGLIREGSRVKGCLFIIRDITDRKHAEEEKVRLEAQLRVAHKMEAIGTLAGGIAHDFNNILGAITLNAEIISDDLPSKGEAQYSMQQLLCACRRAKDLVKQILTFSRDTGVNRQKIDIASITKETLKMIRPLLPATIKIEADIPSDIAIINAHPTQIQQLLMNLSTNAAHAMRKKGGELHITLSNVYVSEMSINPEITAGPYVKLTVRDTGCGIAAAFKERIFDPFFTTKEPGDGTGLGLSVVHGIVASNCGHIEVDSIPGDGTVFNIYLPSLSGKDSKTEYIRRTLPTGKEHILFVDDEETLVAASSKILERLGYRVTTGTSAQSVLKLFQKNPHTYDLVITDMTMPDLTGVELAKKLLDIRADIPIILCTGYNHSVSAEQARKIGIRSFVMKPFTKQKIAEAVRMSLSAAQKAHTEH